MKKLTVIIEMNYSTSLENGISVKSSRVSYKNTPNDQHTEEMFTTATGLPSKYGLAMFIHTMVQGIVGCISSLKGRFGMEEEHMVEHAMMSMIESLEAKKHLDYSDEINNDN